MKTLRIMIAALLFTATTAFALPTVHDIYVATQQGNYRLADSEITQVLKAQPNSAKAHYIHAYVLAEEHRLGQAQSELNRADALDPTEGFANRQSVQHLRGMINTTSRTTTYVNTSNSHWFGIFLVLFLVVLLAFLILWWISSYNTPTIITTDSSNGYPSNPSFRSGPSRTYSSPHVGSGVVGGGTTIINNPSGGYNSGGGFVEGMLIGEALEGGNRGTQVNETVINETNVTNEPSSNNTDTDFGVTSNEPTQSSSPDPDFGTDSSDSNNDFGSSGSDSSSDFGSSSDSDSSSDFGSGGGSDDSSW